MDKHFELKVPGGKLLVIDATVEDNIVTNARLSGDFFLEPDEAYDSISPALVGTKVNDPTDEITARLDAALADFDGLALHGFTTRDVAVTLKRAIMGGTDFTDHSWEVLRPGVLPTPVNVALDELILDQVAGGQRGPTLRFWDWDDKAVVFGSYQSYSNELDQAGVDKMMEVLRIGKVKTSSKGIASAKKRVDPLRRQAGATREEIIETMTDEFVTRYGAVPGALTDPDLAAAQQRVDDKFSTDAWLKRIP